MCIRDRIWIIECKDYPDRRVGVDEVEEFSSKLGQVAAHKGTIVTRKGFQSGAISLATSYKIGLMTLSKSIAVSICASQDASSDVYVVLYVDDFVSVDGTVNSGSSHFLTSVIDEEIAKMADFA